jgi:hypothetical protein
VDQTRTVFWASGTREEVCSFLFDVARALASLPFHRLETERRVLRTEAGSAGGSGPVQVLLGLRFGPQGHGLCDYRELGLDHLQAGDVRHWVDERFTAGNAAVWLTGAPAAGFAPQLRPGKRLAPSEPATLPGIRLPAQLARFAGGVGVGLLVPRSPASTAAVGIAAERIHQELRLQAGLTYSVTTDYLPLDRGLAHVTLAADCLDEHAVAVRDGMLGVLESLGREGPSSEELADSVDETRRWSLEPWSVASVLDAAAADVLFGNRVKTLSDHVANREALGPEEVAVVYQDAAETAIVLAPAGTAPRAGLHDFRIDPPPRPRGRTYRRVGKRLWAREPAIVAGDEGIALVTPGEEDTSIPFASCVAAVRRDDGSISLLGLDGASIEFVPAWLRGGDELLDLIDRRLPADRVVQAESHDAALLASTLALEKIGRRHYVWPEVQRLPQELEPGERLLTLAQVERLLERGLLAVTDRRVLYLSRGFTRRRPRARSYRHEDLLDATAKRGLTLVVADGRRIRFGKVTPRARRKEMAGLVRERLSRASGPDRRGRLPVLPR